MIKSKKKILLILLTVLSIISIGANSYAHSGRTDSSGGHNDNKNKSGLGSYHYHCGGHPAHLHNNGVCPYSSNTGANKSSTLGPSSSSTKTTSTVPTTIAVTNVKINENVTNMKEGESKKLTVSITPNNATDKSITWKSSDESIATVSIVGEVFAKKYGTVYITAMSSNGKESTIIINIDEIPKAENSEKVKILTDSNNSNNNNSTNNTATNSKKGSNLVAGVITLGVLGGGGYWGYKKHSRHNKKNSKGKH